MIKFKISAVIKNLLELISMMILYIIMDRVEGIIKYIIVLVASVLFLFFGRKRKWPAEGLLCVLLPVAIYLLGGSFSALLENNSQTDTIKNILYALVPVMFSFSMYVFYGEKMEDITDVHFFASVLGFSTFGAPYFPRYLLWESTYAFVFGIFVIYYAYRKEWMYFIIAFMFMIFAEKRITVFAVIVALALMGIVHFFRNNKKLVCSFWTIVAGMIYTYLYLIYSGVLEAFCWGANINTNGRVKMYARMAAEADYSIKYLGKGLGSVEQLLSYWKVEEFANLHNDLLKIYIELGFIGFLAYLLSFGVVLYCVDRFFGKKQMTFFLAISTYMMFLFTTDNVSIYIMFLIPLYTVQFAVLSKGKSKK